MFSVGASQAITNWLPLPLIYCGGHYVSEVMGSLVWSGKGILYEP